MPSISHSATPTQVTTTLPLTSIFTPGRRCNLGADKTWQIAIATHPHDANPTLFVERRLHDACFPSGLRTKGQVPVYSPGVCPSGYYAAVPSEESSPATSYCCPLGAAFPYVIGDPSYCYSTITGNYIEVPAQASSSSNAGGNLVSMIETLPGNRENDNVLIGIAQPLTVTWQSSDLVSFTPASAPLNGVAVSHYSSGTGVDVSSGSTGAGTSGSAASTADSAPSSASVSGSNSLSTGAEAGIGVGSAVAGIVIIGLIIWWTLRYRRNAKLKQSSQTDVNAHLKPELDGAAAKSNGWRGNEAGSGPELSLNEVDGRGSVPAELYAGLKPLEEDETMPKYELPASPIIYEAPNRISKIENAG